MNSLVLLLSVGIDSIEQLQAANKQLKDKIKENDQMISFFVKEVADLKQSDAEKTKDISVLRKFQEDTLKGIKVVNDFL